MNLIYYCSYSGDEPILHQINEHLRSHSLESKAAFGIIALYEATHPQGISIKHSYPSELIDLLMQLSASGKLAVSRSISEEVNLYCLANHVLSPN